MIFSALLACGEPLPSTPPPSRFDAVLADPSKVTSPEAFCDAHSAEAVAKPFPMPILDGTAWTPPTSWRWVNVWATWCGPCIEEMPRLIKWRDRLAKEGRPVELVLLSVDQGRPEVERFYDKHPEWPPSVRLQSAAELPGWLEALGLPTSTAIPLHLFVDPAGNVRCVRAGAIGEQDYETVKLVVGGA
jgi:thiol-disulfide isomerase/thioredoxin